MTARLEVETALVRGFLAQDKPVLGMCAGMQTLACLHGAKLDPGVADHDLGASHAIEVGVVFLALLFIGPGSYSIDKK